MVFDVVEKYIESLIGVGFHQITIRSREGGPLTIWAQRDVKD